MEEVDPEVSGENEHTGDVSGTPPANESQYRQPFHGDQPSRSAGSEASSSSEGYPYGQDQGGQGYQGYIPPYGQQAYGPSQYGAYQGVPPGGYYGPQGHGPGFPGYGSPMYSAPMYGAPIYNQQGGYYPPPVSKPTSGLAVASLCCSVGGVLIFFIWPLTAIAGIILGFLALSHIDRSRDTVSGRGLAIAGIIVGFFVVAITIIIIVIIVSVTSSCHTNTYGHLVCH